MDKKTEALKLALELLAVATYQSPELQQKRTEVINAGLKALADPMQRKLTHFEDKALAEQPAPPPECKTDAEKTAFAFGWWKALEENRKQPAQQQEPEFKCLLDSAGYIPLAAEELAALSPQPAQPSKPLTREQVREICEVSGYDKATMQERADFINGIRHAEAAHGIKGDA